MDPTVLQRQIDLGETLPLMEAFHTVQGEGHHQGTSAFFIRLGGCDVGCHWCDVKESWDPLLHPPTPVRDIVEQARGKGPMVVVTGGEPLMYELGPLTEGLRGTGSSVHIETSGAYMPSGRFDWFTLSPKKPKLPVAEAYALADELKVVVYNTNDLRFAEEQAEKVGEDCLLYLQPEWGVRERSMAMIVAFVKENPRWRISLQTHKYLDIP